VSTNIITAPIAPVIKQHTITVKVKGIGMFRARLWLAVQVIRLGVWVSGFGCEVIANEAKDEADV
jgi:hypothetical protein